MDKQLLFIDFEASSLGSSSYPIEVAWSVEDGSIESHLISPKGIIGWTDWDDYAESDIHKISRRQLDDEGKTPLWVASRMNEALKDKVLLSNAVMYDWGWCDSLFRAANLKMQFAIGDALHVFGRHFTFDEELFNSKTEERLTELHLKKISRQSWAGIDGRHRASVDVQQLINMWLIVQSYDIKYQMDIRSLLRLAVHVLEGESRAIRWFTSPMVAFAGYTPFSYAITDEKIKEVRYLLNRIENGIFS